MVVCVLAVYPRDGVAVRAQYRKKGYRVSLGREMIKIQNLKYGFY